MNATLALIPTLMLALVVGCNLQATPRDITTLTPILPVKAFETGRATVPTNAVLSPTPNSLSTTTPGPAVSVLRTFRLVLADCGLGSSYATPEQITLCVTPNLLQLGTPTQSYLSYYMLMIMHDSPQPTLVTKLGVLPWASTTPGPTPASRAQPIGTPAGTPPVMPYPGAKLVQFYTVVLQEVCSEPRSSVSPDRIVLCFADPPPLYGNAGNLEYWTITLTHDLMPTVKHGWLDWARPTP